MKEEHLYQHLAMLHRTMAHLCDHQEMPLRAAMHRTFAKEFLPYDYQNEEERYAFKTPPEGVAF